ncbi:RBBP9/YdeN family alpha/beta hydrolase [Kineosporia babensis]|uniref:Alpha/beta hydrolase n=1 Tax=Kineosporia babensis TaxID=499548 RepID=A0A9X1NMV2_9ACTN|nr:alpha/beta hydrolase [Kineosporia babensis]MCD5316651.1 alpha/beta hydrolase [Kineosporia babensis]
MTSATTERRALIFHGFGATPDDHWFTWLAKQLESSGFSAQVPALPDPLDPNPQRWVAEVGQALSRPAGDPVDQNTVVVAHSLGVLTVLRYLATLEGPWRLGELVLVSGFVDLLPALPNLDAYIGNGLQPAELSELSKHVDRITILRSDVDALVPVELTDRLATLLGVSAVVVPGAGHFLGMDGITELPQALEAITAGRS